MKKHLVTIIVSVVVIGIGLFVLLRGPSKKDGDVLRIPDLVYETLNGSMKLPSPPSEKGYTLLYFWATWSPACYTDLAALDALARKTPRYSVMTVAVDGKGHDLLGSYVSKNNVVFPVARGDLAFVKKLADIPGIPLLLVLDKNRIVLRSYLGSINPQVMAELERGEYALEKTQ